MKISVGRYSALRPAIAEAEEDLLSLSLILGVPVSCWLGGRGKQGVSEVFERNEASTTNPPHFPISFTASNPFKASDDDEKILW